MTTAEYFKRLLPYYKGMYDMEIPYTLNGTPCLAHGHFYSHSEKFVLSREAKLWESNNFEHVFFVECEKLKESDLAKMDRDIRDYVEPVMVRKGKPYPDRNHMYTYITFVFLCSSRPEKELIKSVKQYHFSRNYLFTFRGFCEARAAVVSLDDEKIYTNRAGSSLTRLYKKLMSKQD